MVGSPVPQKLGSVSFEISCKPEVRADFDRAVALLHSFWINVARETFEHVAATDPACAMAYWGEAMTDLHQLFDSPNPDDIARGQDALTKADAATRDHASRNRLHRRLAWLFRRLRYREDQRLVCRARQTVLGCYGNTRCGVPGRHRSADLLRALASVLDASGRCHPGQSSSRRRHPQSAFEASSRSSGNRALPHSCLR